MENAEYLCLLGSFYNSYNLMTNLVQIRYKLVLVSVISPAIKYIIG